MGCVCIYKQKMELAIGGNMVTIKKKNKLAE